MHSFCSGKEGVHLPSKIFSYKVPLFFELTVAIINSMIHCPLDWVGGGGSGGGGGGRKCDVP